MAKSFDVSKFRKDLTKSISGMSTGFNDPTDWISTGSYALNYLISGDFHKGVPLGKVTVFAGESGAGKSYFCSGNVVKHAQDQGIFVVLIDSENALDAARQKRRSPPSATRGATCSAARPANKKHPVAQPPRYSSWSGLFGSLH